MGTPNTSGAETAKMSRAKYALFLSVCVAVLGGMSLVKGGLFVDAFEADAIHMLDIILRMTSGQTPHIDFSTPLGILSFLPISELTKLGFGVATSFILAQIGIAVLLSPILVWIAHSRIGTRHRAAAWMMGLMILSLVLAVVYGGNQSVLSISMYYNRWAWALAFVALFLAVLRPDEHKKMPRLDGMIIGGLLAILALIKPTFFIAFVVPIVIALISGGAVTSLVFGVVAGGLVAAVVGVLLGFEFYMAYIQDLLSVVTSSTRSAPSASFAEVLNSPKTFFATLTLLLSIIVLRQSGAHRAGLLLLLLAPGFMFVTYQNFGNDPKWLMFLCVFLLVHRPERGNRVIFNADARHAVSGLALASFVFIAPSFQNLVTSPVRHFSEEEQSYELLVTDLDAARDLWVYTDRVTRIQRQISVPSSEQALATYVKAEEPVMFLGEAFHNCSTTSGAVTVSRYMADRLRQEPFQFEARSQFFVADAVSLIWMAGGFEPLQGGAPWYYTGTPGIENAAALVVPLCPENAGFRNASLAALAENSNVTFGAPVYDDAMVVFPVLRGED